MGKRYIESITEENGFFKVYSSRASAGRFYRACLLDVPLSYGDQ